MRIPKKIKIGAHKYDVYFDIDPTNDDDDCYGNTSFKKLKIGINPSYAVSQQEETFFHEVMHVIYNQLGYDKEDNHEQKIQSIAHHLYLFLKENNLI